ncbi:MAG: DoxX family protein [Symploca sp. SIO2E9]|nr:DoxX family protein [Symploca sp. SIO2E9]
MNYIPLVARTFIAIIFLYSGVKKILNFSGTQQMMTDQGLPLVGMLLIGAIVFELLGAISLVLGYKTRWGSLLLIIFLIPSTIIFHNFLADPTETISFLKNLAILGALLMVYYYGAGPVSLDTQTSSADNSRRSHEE